VTQKNDKKAKKKHTNTEEIPNYNISVTALLIGISCGVQF